MSPETPAGVSVLPDASALPVPAPPGVVVVPATHPGATADVIAGVLGAGRCLTVAEALDDLAARRAAALEGPASLARARRADATAATAAALHVRPGLSTVPAGLTGATVRGAAHHLVEAAEALHAAREAVGNRPSYDEERAAEARAAQADVVQARLDRAGALHRANAVLVRANLVAAAIVGGRVASEAFDRPFFLVIVLPLAALAYAAYTVIAPARRSRAAARRRWSALRAMNVSTLAGLAALEERAGAWERRAARMRETEVELRAARGTWTSLVGTAVAIASADRLAADLDAAIALDDAATTAEAAWADALVALQEAEDRCGAGWPPLVVLGPDPTADPTAHGLLLERLGYVAGAASVVLVVAEPEKPEQAAAALSVDVEAEEALVAPPVPVPAGAGGPSASPRPDGIVDLRERVRAGLLRLRAFTASPRDPSAPGPMAADG